MTTTPIDIEQETGLIKEALHQVSGYMDCEKIAIRHIHKQVENGFSDTCILDYLQAVIGHLERATEATRDANIQLNYRFVIGFINTLLRTPSWKSWMLSIQK